MLNLKIKNYLISLAITILIISFIIIFLIYKKYINIFLILFFIFFLFIITNILLYFSIRIEKEQLRLNLLIDKLQKNQRQLNILMDKWNQELNLARKTQKKLIPEKDICISDYQFILKYIPAIEIGGDYCEIFPIDDEHLGFVIADVSGHGIASALISSMLKITSTISKDLLLEPNVFLKYINYYLYNVIGNHFLTMLCGILDLKNHTIKISNSGHCLPLLIDLEKKEIKQIQIYGMCMGIYPDVNFDQVQIQFHPNTILFFYTDGITEAFINEDKIYGERRLMENILLNLNKDIHTMVKNIVFDVFVNRNDKYTDDIAILVIQRK